MIISLFHTMTYRLAKSLVTLREQINTAAPDRSKVSDGWIGDAHHASRSSDHNPHVKDGGTGVVTALDITHDPHHGVHGEAIAESAKVDERTKYVIWNKKIWNSKVARAWRSYKGKNPHTKHVHVSVLPQKVKYDDTTAWEMVKEGIDEVAKVAANLPPAATPKPQLQIGSQGKYVEELQRRLGIKVDGDFGPKTQAAVKSFQKKHGLKADGIVGPYTWAALEKHTKDPAGAASPQPPSQPPTPVPVEPTPPVEPVPQPVEESVPAAPIEGPEKGSPAWVMQFLLRSGFPEIASIVLTANIIWESGGARKGNKIVWDAHGDKGADGEYHSHGAAQWNDKHGRYQELLNFSERHAKEWSDPESQMGYLLHELETTEKKAADALKSATTYDEAMDAAISFWRPSEPYRHRRMSIAKQLNIGTLT